MCRHLLAAFAAFLIAAAARAEDAILVFDASGSMWGQIQGKTKIEIARSVIGDLLDRVPVERRLGLVAYGHRREGDCADIEAVVPVGTDRAAIRAKVNAIKPKGKTPLSDGVRFAAQALRYSEQKATVILVSDGAESCNVDPCALGRELEASGVDFTAHVIGFGLASETESAGLRCLAEATGGRYIGAADATQLAAALMETVAAPPPAAPVEAPATARVVLRATELEGGPEVQQGLEWKVGSAGAGPVFSASDAGVAEAELAPGRYTAEVRRAADGLAGTADFEAHAGSERTVTIALVFPVQAKLLPEPADAAPAGSEVAVRWEGPDREGDFVTVVAKDEPITAYTDYDYTKSGSPVSIRLPVEPGDYELRYVLGRPPRVLASVPISATPVSARIEAPAEVGAGSAFPVSWSGPNGNGDWLTIVAADAAPTAYASYVDADRGSPGTLNAPLAPGPYELRYVAGGRNVIARVPITVAAVTASIEAPAEVAAGSAFRIAWTGPNNSGDWLTIIAPTAGPQAYASYVDADAGGEPALNAPLEPGEYEVRYVAGGREVLARTPVRVTAVSASIEAPAEVAAGSEFAISWQGPGNNGDWLTIVKPATAASGYGSYVDAPNGSPGTLQAPAEPGEYELRYVQAGKVVLARRSIRVLAR